MGTEERAATGAQLRDDGIARAVAHADSVEPRWSDRAYEFINNYARAHKQFTGEDAREASEEFGLPVPPEKRAWGGVMLRASRAKIIRKIGYAIARDPKVHCSPNTLWESNIA